LDFPQGVVSAPWLDGVDQKQGLEWPGLTDDSFTLFKKNFGALYSNVLFPYTYSFIPPSLYFRTLSLV